MTIKFCAKQVYSITFVILVLSIQAFAQTDAERFAEGRVALDKYKDCSSALRALDAVSFEGRKNPLWVFYMAKATECLNRFEDALKYYQEYDRLIPGQAAVLDKIGELRYQLGLQQKRQEAEFARRQKDEDDRRARESEIQGARSRLASARQALNNELSGSWKYKHDEKTEEEARITTAVEPPCRLQFTIQWQYYYHPYYSKSSWMTQFESRTENVALNLTKVKMIFFANGSLVITADRNDMTNDVPFLSGSWEEVRKNRTENKKDALNNFDDSRRGSLPDDTTRSLDLWRWMSSDREYHLVVAPDRSEESLRRLREAFELAVATCKKAVQ